MNTYKLRYRIWFKIIAAVVVCLFSINIISSANPAVDSASHTLAPPLASKPICDTPNVSNSKPVDTSTHSDRNSKESLFTDLDRTHMLEILDYTKNEIASGRLSPELPVVARIVDGNGNTVVTTGRKQRNVVSKYGVNAFHAEIQAIREAEAKGFTGWAEATMYTNLESCYNCSKALTESYGFKRVVYGLKDTTLEESDDYAVGYKRENVQLVECNDQSIVAELDLLFKAALEKRYNHPSVKAPMHATGLKVSGEFRKEFRRRYGEDVQVVVFNADLWTERGKIPWVDHHGNVKDAEERDMFRHIEWHKQNLNPTKKHVLVIVGSNKNTAKARKRIVQDKIFENKNIIIYTPKSFFDFTSDTPFVLEDDACVCLPAKTEQKQFIPDKFDEFKTKYSACYALLAHKAVNEYIYGQILKAGFEPLKIRRDKVLLDDTFPRRKGGRDIDRREVPDPGSFDGTDKKHMTELVRFAKKRIQNGTLNKDLPVAAMIVDDNDNTIIISTRKKFTSENPELLRGLLGVKSVKMDKNGNLIIEENNNRVIALSKDDDSLRSKRGKKIKIKEKDYQVKYADDGAIFKFRTKYGVGAVHAEVQAIRDAEKSGFSDWGNATIYILIDSCDHCSKTIIEFYGFKKVVYGVEDPTLAPYIRGQEEYAKNGIELSECNDPSIRSEIYKLFEKHFKGRYRDPVLGRRLLSAERELSASFRKLHKDAFGKDIQVIVFDADLWIENRHDKAREAFLFRHLEWLKQDLNPEKKHMLLLIGEDQNCHEARERIVGDRIFDEENIKIHDPGEPLTPGGVFRPDAVQQEILIVAIPDLLKNTGQIAHIGLGQKNGLPVIYIDSKYFHNEDAIQHEKEEIAQWEAKRRELGLTYTEMREWIKTDPEAKKLAREFNDASRDMTHLYEDIRENPKDFLDLDNIYAAYLAYGLDADDTDVNIANHNVTNMSREIKRCTDLPGKMTVLHPVSGTDLAPVELISSLGKDGIHVYIDNDVKCLRSFYKCLRGMQKNRKISHLKIYLPESDKHLSPSEYEKEKTRQQVLTVFEFQSKRTTQTVRYYVEDIFNKRAKWFKFIKENKYDLYYEGGWIGAFMNVSRVNYHTMVLPYLRINGLFSRRIPPWCAPEELGLSLAATYVERECYDYPYVGGNIVREIDVKKVLYRKRSQLPERTLRRVIDEKSEGFPAKCLETIRDNPDLLGKALSKSGITADDIAEHITYFEPGEIDREFEILEDLEIIIPVEMNTSCYRFSDMLTGNDKNYTKTMINAINDIKYQVGKKGEERPLNRYDIPKDKRPAVKELIKMTVLHQANLMQRPATLENEVLWHIIERDVLSDSQKNSFAQQINTASMKSDSPERIWILKRKETIEEAIVKIKAICPNVVFDVALSSPDHIEKVPALEGEKEIKMLVFKGSVGDFSQIEGVVAALRALHLKKEQVIPALLRIYSIMAGTSYSGEIPSMATLEDIREFARKFIFDLPPATGLPINDIPKLNERLKELLMAA